jgi:hypothetical protein
MASTSMVARSGSTKPRSVSLAVVVVAAVAVATTAAGAELVGEVLARSAAVHWKRCTAARSATTNVNE